MAVVKICVAMPRAVLEELDRFAERDDRSRSATIRQGLRLLFALRGPAAEDVSARRDGPRRAGGG